MAAVGSHGPISMVKESAASAKAITRPHDHGPANLLISEIAKDAQGKEAIYQHQDTHWTDRGLRLAAEILARRVKEYAWFRAAAAGRKPLTVRETTFTRYGDLHSRLPDSEKPLTVRAHLTPANGLNRAQRSA